MKQTITVTATATGEVIRLAEYARTATCPRCGTVDDHTVVRETSTFAYRACTFCNFCWRQKRGNA